MTRGRGGSGRALDEAGAASVTALGIAGAIVAVSIAVVPVLGVFVASQEAANAADAAALAAADAISGAVTGVPCELADAVAARNGATLVSCEGEGPVATVRVAVERFGFTVAAAARAGPPGWTG
jgi:secretion/DNA translocation related TadE-like protein